MPLTRLAALLALTGGLAGSLTVTARHAWRLHSDDYRRDCERTLSESLRLPSQIGRVVPRSRSARQFDDVVVWLPQRRGRALTCDQSVVRLTPEPGAPEAYEIELFGGACEISTRTWLREDYRGVVESGLRPGFAPGGPRRVRFSGMNLEFERDRFSAALFNAAGQVSFEGLQRGRAHALCYNFNGHDCGQPVLLTVEFSPRDAGVRIDHLELKVPPLPLESAGVDALAGVAVRTGRFAGALRYRESDEGRALSLSGSCEDLDLRECTSLLASPVPGQCPTIELQELRLVDARPVELRFRGTLVDVDLGALLENWEVSGVGGALSLRVGQAHISPRGIERLVASGECRGISLEALTTELDHGRMTGTVHVRIEDLTIVDNRLHSLAALVQVDDAVDPPNWVEARLVLELLRNALRVELPAFIAERLPERFEYTRLGVRLDVRDEELRLSGTHGPAGRTLLTARLMQREVPLVSAPSEPIDLRPWLDALRRRAAEHAQRLGSAAEPSTP